ncbi:hypothetical protein P3342_007327 [Pyrenophora teres f. teres]|nr:hypothetical protein P3342_007327 [Pyrenophora teres f. teres]
MKNLLRTIQGQLTPDAQTPGGTPSAGHQQAPTHNPPAADLDVRKFEKPRLPDVKVFDKGSHEEYTQWKIQIRTKLSADRLAYPTEFYQVHYLDGFFEDPAVKQKALQYLRLGEKNDSLKIDYLQNSLNKKLLRYQAGYQPPLNETYDNFVQRMRVTWENLKAIDQLSSNAPIYSTKLSSTNPTTSDEMDWSPTVGAMQFRTRGEYWGTQAQIAQRREEGSCLRCGRQGHLVRQCKATVPKRQRKPENTAKVLAANVEDESSDEGKEEP